MISREKLLGLFASLTMVACTGPVPTEGVEVDTSKIVGGTTTSGDPSVVLIFAYGRGGGLCTGEVIAPRAVMTAAHCVHPDEVGTDVNFVIYNGPELNKALFSDFIRASEGIPHPDFDPQNVGSGNDIGLLIFDKDIVDKKTGKPYDLLPWNRKPLAESLVNQPVRFVGYGVTSGDPQADDSGIKRETTSTLTYFDDLLLAFDDKEHNTCSGDSGGPAFMNLDGKETIVGVTSFGVTPYGQQDCENGGYNTRVDLYVDWVDSVIEQKTGWIHPDKRPTLVLGDACSAHKECTSNICAFDNTTQSGYCTTTCDPKAKDQPAGYTCSSVDGNHLLLKGVKQSGGCDMTGSTEAGAFGLLVFAALLAARRRQSAAL